MKYNEEIADRLKRKYNLAASTIRTWKYRNHIPDRYVDPNYKPPKKANNLEIEEFERIYDLKYIVIKKIGGIPDYRFRDHKREGNHALVSKNDIKMIKLAMRKVQASIQKYLKKPSEKKLVELLALPIIRKEGLLNNNKVYDKLRKGKYDKLTEEEHNYLQQRLENIASELPFTKNIELVSK